jgi:tetratricopeptide (TPR) repeat protein
MNSDEEIPSIIDSKGNVILENAELVYYYNNSNYALAKQKNSFYTIDLKTQKAESYTLLRDMQYIDHYKKYKIIKYKGIDVYVTTKNQILMAKGIDFSDYDFNVKVSEARDLYYSGEYDQAISKLLTLNNEKSNDYDVNLLLGQCYNSKNDNYRALEYFNSAIEIDPNNTLTYRLRLEINFDKKNWNDARTDIYKLMSFNTGFDEDLTFKLAYCCSELNQNNEAFDNYTKIIKNNPKEAMAYNNRGVIYASRGEHQLALNDYINALKNSKYESNESKGLYLNNAGLQCMKLNKKAEACAYWSKGAALDDRNCISNKKYYCK